MAAGDQGQSGARGELLARLTHELHDAASGIVDRVMRTMPAAYFNDTDQATRMTHLKAIIAAEATGLPQEIRLRSEDGSRFTFIHERSYPGQLAALVCQLPDERPLRSAKVHTATDGGLVLDVFEFGERTTGAQNDAARSRLRDRLLDFAGARARDLRPDELEQHLASCDADYLSNVPDHRICEHVRFLRDVRGTESTGVQLTRQPDGELSDLRVGVGHVDPRLMFQRIARYLGHRGIDIHRAYLNSFGGAGVDAVSLISLLIRDSDGTPIDVDGPVWAAIERDLQRLKWLDESTLELAYRLADWSLGDVDTLVALCRLSHHVLIRRVAPTVAGQRVLEACERNRDLARRLVDMFLDRLRGPTDASEPSVGGAVASTIDNEVDSDEDRRVLRTFAEVCGACRATNVVSPRRYASSFEVDPALLGNDADESAFGVYFVHGRDFEGFHVRFRDISRGGLRIVRPRSWEQHTLESERLYQEAYGLAFAQQLKNKDIPEGGSKGVILLRPAADPDSAGRAYADALLDLLVPDKGRRLYLGPDENVSNELIGWIVDRARARGYPTPNAFMSSKPGVGINHKEYGVTSEGLTVFLEVALNHLGIDPRRQSFTLKLTGGPDGDVAGNEIRILHREYGAHARIVGIADGSGCAEDPLGLDARELLRLTEAVEPIAAFDRGKLGPAGRLLRVDEPGGLRARNTLHNRVQSDAFVPAGGRPRTIHRDNWEAFLAPDGTPSSRLIVEGANLYLTPEARRALSERGVVIIKDSSANKCGVICSSFEILASMVWTDEEFLTLKSRFVSDVMTKLRELARLEAELLFDEHVHRPAVSLPELSTRLSRIINRAADAVTVAIRDREKGSRTLVEYLIAAHFPRVLVEQARDRLLSHVPAAYLESAVATVLASRMVYREGLAYVEEMPGQAIADLALCYLDEEIALARMVDQLDRSDLPEREQLARLLRDGGTRAALRGRGRSRG